jgi:cytoskeleton protein RodZ
MDSGVGSILRKARSRRKIELSEVEAATRIRLRYLRAIESEDWEVLPGGVYTRGFIRTYAAFLGLDGERLAEDYRQSVEGPSGDRRYAPEPVAATGTGSGRSPRRGLWRPLASWAVIASVALVALIVIVALPDGDGGGNGVARQPPQPKAIDRSQGSPKEQPPSSGISVRLVATAEVWVCVLDATGRHLVDGQILDPGAEEGPFRSGSFTVSFGNGEVSMTIDGKEAEIPQTSSPIGYSIGADGALTELAESERPTCV